MANRSVAVLGAGGHAAVVASTLMAAGYDVAGFFDDAAGVWGTEILGIPVVGAIAMLATSGFRRAVLGIGDNRARKALAERFDLEWVTAVHPGVCGYFGRL